MDHERRAPPSGEAVNLGGGYVIRTKVGRRAVVLSLSTLLSLLSSACSSSSGNGDAGPPTGGSSSSGSSGGGSSGSAACTRDLSNANYGCTGAAKYCVPSGT